MRKVILVCGKICSGKSYYSKYVNKKTKIKYISNKYLNVK